MPPIKKIKEKSTKTALVEAEAPVISGQLDKKMHKNKLQIRNQRGLVVIKHLPHGFFEEQLRKYFQQFGTVTRLRLARSKYTGGSKGYAFVEFEYPEVAEVAAVTMNNYLMFKRVIKASYIPSNDRRFHYFKTSVRKVTNKAGKEIYVSAKTEEIKRNAQRLNDWSENVYQKRMRKNLKRIEKLKDKYKHLGIDFSNLILEPKVVGGVAKAEKSLEEKNVEIDEKLVPENTNIKENDKFTKTVKNPEREIELQELLGDTIAEDSDDHDWEFDALKSDQSSESSDEESFSDDICSEEENELLSNIQLQDLLGETIAEDSEDIDWEVDASKIDSSSSDEESLNDEELSEEEKELITEAADIEIPMKKMRTKKFSFAKSTKPTKPNPLDQLIKRKPHLGGIIKSNKKHIMKPNNVSKVKESMKVAAVKELATVKAPLMRKLNKKSKLVKKQNKK